MRLKRLGLPYENRIILRAVQHFLVKFSAFILEILCHWRCTFYQFYILLYRNSTALNTKYDFF